MPGVTINVDEILATVPVDEASRYFVEFTADPAMLRFVVRRLWVLILLLAERDRATSVHYHPW